MIMCTRAHARVSICGVVTCVRSHALLNTLLLLRMWGCYMCVCVCECEYLQIM